MTPIDAFVLVVLYAHAPTPCPMPRIVHSQLAIEHVCQPHALPGYRAQACYVHGISTIYLPERDNDRLLLHEMGRHVYDKCLGRRITDDELLEVEELR